MEKSSPGGHTTKHIEREKQLETVSYHQKCSCTYYSTLETCDDIREVGGRDEIQTVDNKQHRQYHRSRLIHKCTDSKKVEIIQTDGIERAKKKKKEMDALTAWSCND